ncbi:hypothetical protein DTO166G4_839 [Paecilomyces variotii]|uniref:Uncharacterized protein n=1 Tax=Byssochlamys spectabilis TaxID=264951 RepID=A0A443I515_BYSSP|nr:hypothetical protein C8Q69DRAFT_11210 [Paecilomyces variotii]KAJ9217657.1 hypothetical protein DTO166G4_839 [Paecilomyces variotii]KAJ9226405.1 hypothetical protein DTO169C6_1133 [Paecilomyces variotii]KAJ9237811.1 hypothetical protein DTO169E5_4982 [Paecilomyces variotii]KAJ9243173.1 hypothetical protein DTO166G5_277 [Paecilomyces variotii]KAJ9255388.1 hypothetical protein DTO207G8_3144 [Paecilomyces variotii]
MSGETPIVSHGRGGHGNIGKDDTPYADASIVREGPVGDQGDGAYSAGRGGAGNIGSPHIPPSKKAVHDNEMIPELAIRNSTDENYHTGRGGQGNVHLDEAAKKGKEKEREEKEEKKKNRRSVTNDGLANWLKEKLLRK